MADTAAPIAIVPWPASLEAGVGEFVLTRSTAVLLAPDLDDTWSRRADTVLQPLRQGTRLALPTSTAPAPRDGCIFLAHDPGLDAEAYRLVITPARVELRAGGPDGLGWGLQTMRQLLPAAVEVRLPSVAPDPGREGGLRPLPADCVFAQHNVRPAPGERPPLLEAVMPADGWRLPAVTITDQPRFGWRGVLLDCCRHFMDIKAIERLLDLMALHKLNRLHWHLTEDQGWRLQIVSHPELTTTAAWRRDADGTRYGGFYTQDQARHIVAYAAARGITVVPEIELPGHSQAVLAANPHLGCTGQLMEVQSCWGVWPDVYCAGNEQTFAFLKDVFVEVLDIFPSEFIHIGGDECPKDRWRECPKCQQRIRDEKLDDEHQLQSWFVGRMERWLAQRGRRLVGWDEILEGGLPAGATVQSWRGVDGAIAAAGQGHDTVVSPTSHCYLDYDFGGTDLATAHGFDPVPADLPPDQRHHVLGGEMNLWTEYAPQAVMDERLFPRLCGLADAMWRDPQTPDADFTAFWRRYQQHRVRLDRLGVQRAYEARPVKLRARWQDDAWHVTWPVDAAVPRGTQQVLVTVGDAADVFAPDGHMEVNESARLSAQLLVDGQPYGAPWQLELDHHLAMGAAYEAEPWPGRKYRPEEPHAALDGVLPDVDYHDGRWLAWEGPDATVTVDLGRPQTVRRVQAMCLHAGGALIYSPERVTVAVSTDGEEWTELGTDGWRLPPQWFARTLRTYTVDCTPQTARWVRLTFEQRQDVPAWPWAPLSPPWMFVGQVVVR